MQKIRYDKTQANSLYGEMDVGKSLLEENEYRIYILACRYSYFENTFFIFTALFFILM